MAALNLPRPKKWTSRVPANRECGQLRDLTWLKKVVPLA